MDEPLAKKAYAVLEEKFIKGYYMPNEKLSENQLCKQLNMSRTPIRQALSQFIEKGYITSVDKKGIFVKPISIKYALDCRDVVMVLEKEMCSRLSTCYEAIRFDELQQIIEQQKKAQMTNDYYLYLHYHFEFRTTLFRYVNNSAMTNAYKYLVKDMIRIAMVIWCKTAEKQHYSLIEKDYRFLTCLHDKNFEKLAEICCDPYTFEIDALKSSMYKMFLADPDFVE